MISTLHIKNIGIIEDLTVDLNTGFNVLTGETGAGKTLIIDSLNLACGGRFSKEIVRRGENFCLVELNIYLPQNENSIDGNIIVSREINSNGRNLCKINGRMVTVNELKDFMKRYIEIHGQNDNQTLLESKTHLMYLDSFIGDKIIEIKSKYYEKYQRFNEINIELKANYADEKERERKLDLLRYQISEIEEANLTENEEEILEEKRKIMLNSEKISNNLNKADEAIQNSSIDSLSIAIRALEKIETIDKNYEKVSSNLKGIYYELQELARDISNYKEDIYFDEQERNKTEERLDLINSLKRKYGNTIKEILEYKKEIQEEIQHIENLEDYNNKLKSELEKIQNEMEEMSEQINKIRVKQAQKLSESINLELKDLEMKNAKINVKVEKQENFNKEGKDKVEFLISTNLGEDEKELSKIASGGEVSRIMLAIKTVLADTDKVPVMIFDEIDTGISGKAAKSVAEKMKIIAKKHQVLCITHQANIAAKGDYNYYISKNVQGENTVTSVKLLSEDEVINEIARISSGDITQTAINHAKEMRKAV